jgi:hypothetical protein
MGALDDDLLAWRPAADEWCIKEIIGHLIETDRLAFRGRIELMLAHEHPALGGMDVHGVATARQDDGRPLGELLAELRAERALAAPLVAGLTRAELERTGAYAKLGELRVADLVYEWPFHDAAHLTQMQEIIRLRALPGMSAAMQAAVSA